MFDTMTMTKIVGGFCGALLIFLLGNWAAELILHTGGEHGEQEQAYVIDTGENEKPAADAKKETGPSFAELFVNADPDKGARVFNKCKACHNTEKGANSVGPYLYGVVGRKVASAEGYSYSGNLSPVADVWTPRKMNKFLTNPSEYAPGTRMGFAGLDDVKDRANVIAYLDQTDGDTYQIELPEKQAAADETTQGAADQASADKATGDGAAAEGEKTAAAATGADAGGAADGFAAMVAAADPADGKKIFRKCQACHVADKKQNRVGPYLMDVVGRKVASVDGFSYSDALKSVGGTWTLDKLNSWLKDPRGFAKGTRMSFPGLKDEKDRASVVAYLKSLSN